MPPFDVCATRHSLSQEKSLIKMKFDKRIAWVWHSGWFISKCIVSQVDTFAGGPSRRRYWFAWGSQRNGLTMANEVNRPFPCVRSLLSANWLSFGQFLSGGNQINQRTHVCDELARKIWNFFSAPLFPQPERDTFSIYAISSPRMEQKPHFSLLIFLSPLSGCRWWTRMRERTWIDGRC